MFRSGRSTEAEEMRVAKRATVGLGLVAILLGLGFKGQNVAFMTEDGLDVVIVYLAK